MRNTDEYRDPIPEQFATEEEAAEFWATHSIADYEEFLEPVDVDFDLQRRHFEIEVDEMTFRELSNRARETQRPIKDLASQLLSGALVSDAA